MERNPFSSKIYYPLPKLLSVETAVYVLFQILPHLAPFTMSTKKTVAAKDSIVLLYLPRCARQDKAFSFLIDIVLGRRL